VRPFSPGKPGEAAAGSKWMISKGGGNGNPDWRDDGKELFYTNSSLRQMAVTVNTDKTFELTGTARRLFDIPPLLTSPDAAGDGKRFLFAMPVGANAQTPMTVILNWQAALKK